MIDYEEMLDSLIEEKTRMDKEIEKKLIQKELKGRKLDKAELGYKLKKAKENQIKEIKTSKDYNPKDDDRNLNILAKQAKGLKLAAQKHSIKQELKNRDRFKTAQAVGGTALAAAAAAGGIVAGKAIGNAIEKKRAEKARKEEIQNKINEIYEEMKTANSFRKKELLSQLKSLTAQLNGNINESSEIVESTAYQRYLDKKIKEYGNDGSLEKHMKNDKAIKARYNQRMDLNQYNFKSHHGIRTKQSQKDLRDTYTKRGRQHKSEILPGMAQDELKRRKKENNSLKRAFKKKLDLGQLNDLAEFPGMFNQPKANDKPYSKAVGRYRREKEKQIQRMEKKERQQAASQGKEFVPSQHLRKEEKKLNDVLTKNNMDVSPYTPNKEKEQFIHQQEYQRSQSPYGKAEATDKQVVQNAKNEKLANAIVRAGSKSGSKKDMPITTTQNKTGKIIGTALATGAVAGAGALIKNHYDKKKKAQQEEEMIRNEVNNIPPKFLRAEYNRAIKEGNIKKANIIKERM